MRIISGSLGGRRFDSPKGSRTHPMADKVRGALFNTLGDISGLTVLDAFSGSGALALEAISRGAKHVAAIDVDKNAVNSINNNAQALNISSQIKAIRANAGSWSDNNPDAKFDLVLLDPPYNQINEALLHKLAAHANQGRVVVFSLPPTTEFMLPTSSYQLLSDKNYGDARLFFYRRIL